MNQTSNTPHRNWKKICKINNRLLKMALSTIDLTSEEGKKLAKAFPRCFGDKFVGPIPMSVILENERQEAIAGGNTDWQLGKFLVSHGAIPAEIPIFRYGFNAEAAKAERLPLLPSYIKPKETPVGSVVEIDGEMFVVVENNDNDGVEVMYVVPSGCIDIDCEVIQEIIPREVTQS